MLETSKEIIDKAKEDELAAEKLKETQKLTNYSK